MNINDMLTKIKDLDVLPSAFQEGFPIWDNAYISRHMLKAHLDESHDRASYNSSLRKAVAGRIIEKCKLKRGDTLLDLGCGPGMYAQEFAQHGISYTGIDVSSQSLGYAMMHKGVYKDDIEYIQGDYTQHQYDKKYDCISMIWCDFGALSPAKRGMMLDHVKDALKPKGRFCFDVFATTSPFEKDSCSFRVEEDGFWQEGLYAVLERNTYYQSADASLDMAIVANEKDVKPYYIWDKRYNKDELIKVLKAQGFKSVLVNSGGLSQMQHDMLGVFCKI